jgi:hypothetical protein
MRRLIASSALVLMACGGGDGAADGASGGAEAAAVAPLGTGSISGMVMFSGTAPMNDAIDMSEEDACNAKWPDGVTNPVVAVTDGNLANVFVRVTAGLPAGPYPTPAGDAVIDQDGCLYTPRVVGVMTGQNLEIRNSDPLLHNVKATPTANRGFNRSQPREGMSTNESFSAAEVMVPLECSVHGWMNGFVGVVDHPYFATSVENGSFNISGLPDGTYTVEAWHETLGTQTAEVTVSGGAAGTVEFTFGG